MLIYSSTSPDHHKLIVVLIDEMHIKEELVYNKHNGRLIGFVDLGNINNHLARFEDALCDHEKTETYVTESEKKALLAIFSDCGKAK